MTDPFNRTAGRGAAALLLVLQHLFAKYVSDRSIWVVLCKAHNRH